MGKRLSVEEKLAAVRRLREQDPSPRVTAELRSALGDKSNLIVAAAAGIVGDQKVADLSGDLEAAFERLLLDPLKSDKLCRGKLAVVQALDKLEHDRPDIFLKAARHVQFEPVWGGQEDTAAPLRAAGLLALARLDDHGLLPLLVDSLTDPQKEVRIAAAQALGYHGTESAGLLLRLKARIGDNEPEVVSECLSGLLNCSPQESLPFVSQFLESADTALREAAILALGRSRIPEAFDALKACWQRDPLGLKETLLLAMAMLRLPAANEFLLELVATGPETVSSSALSALMIHLYDPRLRQRIAEAIDKSGSRSLRAKFERDSRKGE
jgi:HEAT repeat protein